MQFQTAKGDRSPKTVLQGFVFGGTNKVLVNRDPLECVTAFGGFLFALLSASLLLGFVSAYLLAMANINEINVLRDYDWSSRCFHSR